MELKEGADILIKAMKIHSKNEVANNAIQTIHREGYVKEVLGNNLYIININDDDYKLEAREGLTLELDDLVIVMLFNGDINKAWIIDKHPITW